MTEKDENVIDVGNEEFIDSEEWKDNFLRSLLVQYIHFRQPFLRASSFHLHRNERQRLQCSFLCKL